MMCPTVAAFLIAISAQIVLADMELLKYMTPCVLMDDQCLKTTLEQLRPHLDKGVPEFNLPPIDPFSVPDYNQSMSRALEPYYAISFTDIKYAGASNFAVSKIHFDGHQKQLNLVLEFPQATLLAAEAINASGFGMKIDGSGRLKATFSNLTVEYWLGGTDIRDAHMEWDEDNTTISYDEFSFGLDDWFQQGDDYEAYANKFLGYQEMARTELERLVKNTFGKFFLGFVKLVHDVHSSDALYALYN